MKPEEKAEVIIWQALRPFVKEIYFNRKNKIHAPVFYCTGYKTPDILLKTNNNKFIVMEVKPANKDAKVQSGKNQLLERYYFPFMVGAVEYFIEGKQISPDHFILMTEMMVLKGYLFENREDLIDNLEDSDRHKEICIKKYKIMPRFEYSRTYDLTRSLFSQLKEFRDQNPKLIVKRPGLGIIMKDYETKEYMLFSMSYYKQWGHRYRRLNSI
jgi:hypothetical protein